MQSWLLSSQEHWEEKHKLIHLGYQFVVPASSQHLRPVEQSSPPLSPCWAQVLCFQSPAHSVKTTPVIVTSSPVSHCTTGVCVWVTPSVGPLTLAHILLGHSQARRWVFHVQWLCKGSIRFI